MKKEFCSILTVSVLATLLSGCFTARGNTLSSSAGQTDSTVTVGSESSKTEMGLSETPPTKQNVQSDSSRQTAAPVFNFITKTVRLNSGHDMPVAGLGTYALSSEDCYNAVTTLLESGGRLIDTASFYGNEESVGQAIRDSAVSREEIFVTTKLYPTQFLSAEKAIEQSLQKLDIGYIDLLLLHHPATGDVEAYHTMERDVEDGKIRSIGLSNWYIEELEEFLPQVTIIPAVVQNEIHPY